MLFRSPLDVKDAQDPLGTFKPLIRSRRVSKNGRMDGYWQPRKGCELVSGELTVSANPLRLPFWLADTAGGKTITGASRTNATVTLTVTSHGFAAGTSSYMSVEGLGYTTVNPNGVWLVTYAGVNSLTFQIPGATGSETYTLGGGDDKILARLLDTASSSVLGSCVYSDPSSNNQEYVILAMNGTAKKVAMVPPYTVTDLRYPTGETLSSNVELLQAFDRVMLFRDGARPWCWVPGGRAVSKASLTSNVVTVTCKDHGLTAADVVTISGFIVTGKQIGRAHV